MNRLPALRFLCRCLGSPEPDRKRSLETEITSQRVPWELVVELAGQYYMTPALHCALRGKGLLELVPADLRDYLATIHSLNSERNRRLVAQVFEVARILNQIEIEPLLMKGVGNVLAGVYPDPGVRMAEDLDLLVPAGRLQAAWLALTAQGYTVYKSGDHDHHLASLHRKGRVGVVELHGSAPQGERQKFLTTEEIIRASTVYELDGGRVRVASASYRVIIAVSHAYVHDRSALLATLPLRDLYDVFFHLDSSLSLDWDFIAQIFDRAGHARRALRKALFLVERLFGPALPQGVAPRTQALWFWYACLFCFRYPRTGQIVFRETAAVCELLYGTVTGQGLRKNLASPEWYIRHFKSLLDGAKHSPKS